jgi:hypothetical protein
LAEGKYNYQWRDLTGKALQNDQSWLKTESLDFSNLKNGVYFLGIEGGEKRIFRKMVIQR